MKLQKLFVFLMVIALCFTVGYSGRAIAQTTTPTTDQTDEHLEAAAISGPATEALMYDLNRVVTTKDRGFPRDQPPLNSGNGNWFNPVNFAQGTVYYRIEIRRQPQPQKMQVQLCIWQDAFALENCGQRVRVTGNPRTVITWSQPVQQMWKKGGKSIDWSRPRLRYGLSFKTANGKPMSPLKGWNWSGQNPQKWFPLDMRFTAVVVAKDATFGGWSRYVGSSAASAETVTATAADLIDWTADLDEGSGLTAEVAAEQEAAEQANLFFLPLVITQ